MKRPVYALFLFVFMLAACNQSADNTNSDKKDPDPNHQKAMHAFSDIEKKDTFEVNLTGNKPADMVVAFTITRFDGQKIYDIKIKATDLLGSTDPNIDLRKEQDQINFIHTIVKEFLSEEKFLVPAVTKDQEPDDYAPDKNFYTELKQTGLNGFTYRLGKENNYYIAWSEAEKKVKIYYNCC
ncbi:MAG: hypothetical protein EOO89_23145 [Pedobacter sp.]|nr:MAG: hypothetical protein EOO89_23145 [Pedobacter sp.]